MSRSTPPGWPRPISSKAPDGGQGEGHDYQEPVGWSLPGLDHSDLEPADLAEDSDEMREFLLADLRPSDADPVFKEKLRRKLWRLVQAQYGTPKVDEDEG
jgi:hypothetical protein